MSLKVAVEDAWIRQRRIGEPEGRDIGEGGGEDDVEEVI